MDKGDWHHVKNEEEILVEKRVMYHSDMNSFVFDATP